MNRHRNRNITLIAAALLMAAGTASAAAQGIVTRVQQQRAYLGFSYVAEQFGPRGNRSAGIVVVDVVDGSPAARAGLAIDDTILSINDIRVSDQFVSSLSSSLEPGDRVRLRIRRDGREREITVEAARRPPDYGLATPRTDVWSYAISPDSMRGRLRVFLPDSAWLRTGRAMIYPRDSFFMHVDTLAFSGAWPNASAFSFNSDSIFGHLDSLFVRAMPRGFSFKADTIRLPRFDGQLEGGRIFGLRGDSLFKFETLPGGAGIARFGMSAIAGAELTELNEGLGEYFGADEGVLVVRVPDRTPAARAGLEAGDVIVRANGRDVSTVSELRRAVTRSGDDPVRLEIIRRNSRRTIELRQ
jgi:membrane-associated protease RseP (regulator of RpoE activity)